MALKAKVTVLRVERRGKTESVEMHPVTSEGSPENKAFWAATPSGSITLHIDNEAAHGFFVPGHEYVVTFEPAAKGHTRIEPAAHAEHG